jgi:hypothetical protein
LAVHLAYAAAVVRSKCNIFNKVTIKSEESNEKDRFALKNKTYSCNFEEIS